MKNLTPFVAFLLVLLLNNAFGQSQRIVPVIDLKIGGLLGGSRDGKWLEAFPAAESIMNGAMDLDVFRPTGKQKQPFYAARRAPVEDPCDDFFGIQMEDNAHQTAIGIGVNAKWNAMPRTPKRLDANSAVYKAAVIAMLKRQGIKRPVAKISQIFSIDLDADGTNEVLITATNIKSQFGFGWGVGEYSFSMLRKVTKAGVKDYLLDGNFFKSKNDSGGAPDRYQITGIADLNGDGKMEIVLFSEYYEGEASGAFEMRNGKPELIKELQIGCGV